MNNPITENPKYIKKNKKWMVFSCADSKTKNNFYLITNLAKETTKPFLAKCLKKSEIIFQETLPTKVNKDS